MLERCSRGGRRRTDARVPQHQRPLVRRRRTTRWTASCPESSHFRCPPFSTCSPRATVRVRVTAPWLFLFLQSWSRVAEYLWFEGTRWLAFRFCWIGQEEKKTSNHSKYANFLTTSRFFACSEGGRISVCAGGGIEPGGGDGRGQYQRRRHPSQRRPARQRLLLRVLHRLRACASRRQNQTCEYCTIAQRPAATLGAASKVATSRSRSRRHSHDDQTSQQRD